ncbi:MAG TPA: TIGR03118 family protein [Gaiellales bacterium]|jgi:uncharacterized protein (TIGR03118 family)
MLRHRYRSRLAAVVGLAVVAATALGSAGTAAAGTTHHGFRQINLVSDIPGKAHITDSNLVNPWGLAFGPTTPLWVSDNGTDMASLYAGGTPSTPISELTSFAVPHGAPTGQVFNGSNGFKLRVAGGMRAPARFIVDSEAGVVSAWTPGDLAFRQKLVVPGAVFKGLAIGFFHHHPAVYATDFAGGSVDVVDSHFHMLSTPGAFRDPMVPMSYHPFGIQAIGNRIVVSYAKTQAGSEDEQHGAGLGFVAVFTQNGRLVKHLISHGALNAPWGLVRAPMGFGRFGGDLLVGNFGNGRINAYDMQTGMWQGVLRRPNGRVLAIDGLWGLLVGNGVTGTPHDLLFSAGIDDESHGLLGEIRHVR